VRRLLAGMRQATVYHRVWAADGAALRCLQSSPPSPSRCSPGSDIQARTRGRRRSQEMHVQCYCAKFEKSMASLPAGEWFCSQACAHVGALTAQLREKALLPPLSHTHTPQWAPLALPCPARPSAFRSQIGNCTHTRTRTHTHSHAHARTHARTHWFCVRQSAEHSRAQPSTAEHSRAQPSTAEHSRAQPSTAEHSRARVAPPRSNRLNRSQRPLWPSAALDGVGLDSEWNAACAYA
jgi:hypothetical protein